MEVNRRSHGALVRRTDAIETGRTQIYESEFTLATGIANRCFRSSGTWFHQRRRMYVWRHTLEFLYDFVGKAKCCICAARNALHCSL